MYATGRGVPVDYAEALKWLRKSAEQGDAHGQYNLAAMYMQAWGRHRRRSGSSEVDAEGGGSMREFVCDAVPLDIEGTLVDSTDCVIRQ
jgi:TPR repeat protein